MAYNHYVLVCSGTACESNKGIEIFEKLNSEAERLGVSGEVQIIKTGCFGFCERGPIVKVLPEDSFYVDVTPEDAPEIIAEHILKGREVSRLLYKEEGHQKAANVIEDIGFYRKQMRVALRNCGFINPENIDEYIARDGYHGLEKVLFEWTPEKIIEEVRISGMRGRGGAGFPTWLKWDLTRKAKGETKYVICNADEGDPGAFMDRSLIEGDPHSVIEGMITIGKAIGSHIGYVYIRAEYPLAIDRLKIALAQAQEYGLLGKDILGSGFDFDIEIRLGAGAFVCGEETALIKSVEGNRGMPVPKPPFPANKGLWGMPTVINNVETLVNIPVITTKGGQYLADIGTEHSKGTKVFAITGKIVNSGLVEVPMGITLRELVFEIGGGIRGGKKFKGVQTGGPSGGILTEESLDLHIDFETLTENGSMMGSGGLIVMDEDDCVVDVSRFYMEFCAEESCGKCSPCRIGTTQTLKILEKICDGKGEEADLQNLEDIGHAMVKASLCMLGATAPNPVISTLHKFNDEYREHIIEKKCRAGKCKNLLSFVVDPVKCIGCSICAKKCPANCIIAEPASKYPNKKKPPYIIDQAACVKCGECVAACKFAAILKA
ncbi:MAG: NAD(P)H-dependent oxidoreductase subunit E [Spirochaetes bacterium]|nr:NAD(P)H-dependent oxidoreductase subunit E [Spirochaetota bacterium]